MIESTIYIQKNIGTGPLTCSAENQDEDELDTVVLPQIGTATVWGAFVWDAAPWGGVGIQTVLYPQQLAWSVPIVFRRLSLIVTGSCAIGFEVGRMHLRYEELGYLQAPARATFQGGFSSGFSSGFQQPGSNP